MSKSKKLIILFSTVTILIICFAILFLGIYRHREKLKFIEQQKIELKIIQQNIDDIEDNLDDLKYSYDQKKSLHDIYKQRSDETIQYIKNVDLDYFASETDYSLLSWRDQIREMYDIAVDEYETMNRSLIEVMWSKERSELRQKMLKKESEIKTHDAAICYIDYLLISYELKGIENELNKLEDDYDELKNEYSIIEESIQ